MEPTYRSCIVELGGTFAAALISVKMVQACDARESSHSIQRMTRQFTAQLQGSLSKDNKSQSLHGSETILCDRVLNQTSQKDAKHF